MTSRFAPSRGSAALAALVITLLVAVLLAPIAGTGSSADAATQARRAPDSYSPRSGAKFNTPLREESRRVITRHIYRSLQSTPRGHKVRIASWNIQSARMVDAAIRAHDRGASVRVLMAGAVAERQRAGGPFDRLHRNLGQGNKNRARHMRSWARTCKASCRGWGGIAHTKMYLFTKVGRSRDVVMVSSANMTDVAAYSQWNDMFTVTGREALRKKFFDVFEEMAADRRPAHPYRTYKSGKDLRAFFYPYQGRRAVGDPMVRELKKVGCKGAKGDTGYKGRTVIRIAQTALVGSHGARVANQLRRMHNNGCRIKVLYAVSDAQSRANLGGVAHRQYVQDTDGDGVYDRYLHMKSMTVNGVYDGDRSARVVWNGTANWSPKALVSDEVGFRVIKDRMQKRYANWINRLWANPPPSRMRMSLQGPPARVTDDGQVAGRLVRPDGTVVNPYAKIQLN